VIKGGASDPPLLLLLSHRAFRKRVLNKLYCASAKSKTTPTHPSNEKHFQQLAGGGVVGEFYSRFSGLTEELRSLPPGAFTSGCADLERKARDSSMLALTCT